MDPDRHLCIPGHQHMPVMPSHSAPDPQPRLISPSATTYKPSFPFIRQPCPYFPPLDPISPCLDSPLHGYVPSVSYAGPLGSTDFYTGQPTPSEGTVYSRTEGLCLGQECKEEQLGPAKKKRRRQALSCNECKRRKIKCDRPQPCVPCTWRGEHSECQCWTLGLVDRFVIHTEHNESKAWGWADHDQLRARVDQLEAVISHLVSASPASVNAPSYAMLPDMSGAPLPEAGHSQKTINSAMGMANRDVDMTGLMCIQSWVSDFKPRCGGELEELGDIATNVRQYDEAVLQYTTPLSLSPATRQGPPIEQSKAYVGKGLWEGALNDVNEIIKFSPSSPLGCMRKYQALLGIGHVSDARDVLREMLSEMSKSPDSEVRGQSHRYEETQNTIRATIEKLIDDHPLVLIDANSGRLCNKLEQAAAFELTTAFAELILSPAPIDDTLIKQKVKRFYRYATLSHTWQPNEPLFSKVSKIVVYDLEVSPSHDKLKMFCKLAREEGFNWAWSDTCCINQEDPSTLQESLVSMFKWYEGSAMTIIFLFDVDPDAEDDALTRSKWNSRGWTLQEYHASKVVRIYTKAWTPYLGLNVYNHKDSQEVMREMEKATGISSQALSAIRPGLNDVREKLRLASTRQTTRVEDAAYSLLGIFSMSLPVTYGEGDQALGRLLARLLTSSGDTSILAWTGRSGGFNTCLPTTIAVFSQPLTLHIPLSTTQFELGTAPSFDLSLAAKLYDEMKKLSVPSFAERRLKLPCLTFKTRPLSRFLDGLGYIFRVQAGALGEVEIKTQQDLSNLHSLCLIHPWTDFLLDRHAVVEATTEESSDCVWGAWCDDTTLPLSPSTALPVDEEQILQFVARLREPFGALLLTPNRWNVEEYKRVAVDSLITVQVREVTSVTLDELIQGVQTLDIL